LGGFGDGGFHCGPSCNPDFRDGIKGRAVGRGRYCYGMLGRAPIRSLRPAVPRRTDAVDGSDN
jgi:hypothetical protein